MCPPEVVTMECWCFIQGMRRLFPTVFGRERYEKRQYTSSSKRARIMSGSALKGSKAASGV